MRLLIVDDHVLIRDALHSIVSDLLPDSEVFEAATCAEARALIDIPGNFDLLLLDLNLPDGSGLDLLKRAREGATQTSVVILSASSTHETVNEALRLNAAGFIPKSAKRDVMVQALRLILAGGVYIPPEALGRPPDLVPQDAQAVAPSPLQLGLTDRQLEVLALMMKGKSNKWICRSLELAEPTVKHHVTSIFKALGVSNRTEAVLLVTRYGWKLPEAS